MQLLSKLVHRYPGWIIGAIVLLTAVFSYGATRITVTTDMESFFAEGDPVVEDFNRVSDTFGGSEYVIAATAADDIFTVEGVATVDRLSTALAATPGVAAVRSLTNMETMKGTIWGLEVTPMLDAPPATESDVDEFRQRVLDNERTTGVFLSKDFKNTLLMVQLEQSADHDAVVKDIRSVVTRESGDVPVFLTGGPLLTAELNDVLVLDLLRLSPLVLLLILGILFFSFRSWQGVILPFVTVVISTIWVIGLMGYMHVPFSQLSSILPVVLVSVGSAYGIHVLHRYRDELRPGKNGKTALHRTVTSVGVAVILAGLTTMAGFFSNAFGSVVPIREFGLFTTFGVAVALLISLLFIPSVLRLTRINALGAFGPSDGADADTPTDYVTHPNLLGRVATAMGRRPWVVIGVTLAIAVGSLSGVGRLQTDTNFVHFFDAASEPRVAYDLVQSEFSGVETVQIVLEGEVLEPATLRAMEAMQQELEEIPQLNNAMSIVDVIKEIGQALNDGDPAFFRIPNTREAVAQYLLLLSMSGGSELDELLTLDQREAKVEVPMAAASTAEREAALEQIESIVRKHLSSHGDVTITGMPFLDRAVTGLITRGQVQSLALSLVVVFVILWVFAGSLVGGLFSLTPIAFTIIANFGVMAWGGIRFDVVTALVSSIAVGIGVDYTIHAFVRFRQAMESGRTPLEAVIETVSSTGGAIMLNAGAVALGFLVLMLSSFPPLRTFGLLVALTMAIASVSSLTILPVLLLMAPERILGRRFQANLDAVPKGSQPFPDTTARGDELT